MRFARPAELTPYLRRRRPRTAIALAVAFGMIQLAAALHLRWDRRWSGRRADARIARRLATVQTRAQVLVSLLQSDVERVSLLPDCVPALGGDRIAQRRLFQALEALASAHHVSAERPALAVNALPFAPVAWSGRMADPALLQGLGQPRQAVFISEGSVSTTLVAAVPIADTHGQVRGLAAAAIPLAVRRNIHNQFLEDFDRLTLGEAGVETRYVDVRDENEAPAAFPSPAPGVVMREALVRAPDGTLLASVRVASPPPEEVRQVIRGRYRRISSALLLALSAVVLWPSDSSSPRVRRWRWATLVIAWRVSLLALGPPFPPSASSLLSPSLYASTLGGPLLRSPLDLLFTAAAFATLGLLAFQGLLSRPCGPRSLTYVLTAGVLGIVPVLVAHAWVADTIANSTLDLQMIPLAPQEISQVVMDVSLALIVIGAFLFSSAIFCTAAGTSLLHRLALLLPSALGVILLGLSEMSLLVTALLLALSRSRWQPTWNRASPEIRAATAIVTAGLAGLVLFPILIREGQSNTRRQIVRDYAPLVLRQPQWRDYVLASVRTRIDSLSVLEEAPPGAYPPAVEELAFAVWSSTDLAAFGFVSAVEIQDASGAIISRFALNLPSLAGPARPLPTHTDWVVTHERLSLASAERPVLHAERLLVYHDEVHGAIHVYIANDFSNLPFIRDRDPYSVLYRTASRPAPREGAIVLLAYEPDGSVVFSSANRAPALPSSVRTALVGHPAGFWTPLNVEGQPHQGYVFFDGQTVYALAYPVLPARRYAAKLLEASIGLALLATALVVGVVLARTALKSPTLSLRSLSNAVERRFVLRLFVAFTLLAVVPMAILQVVVRGFLAERLWRDSEDQALDRAGVAKKAVEDFAFFQRGDSEGRQPVTDAALVWVSSLTRTDLDVFEHGRLLASSKRELYSSGLLPPRIDGSVFRALVLEAQPFDRRTESIGGFSYLVVSLPVRLSGAEPAILSIPLGLRQREVEAVLDDLDRTIRLGSVLFLIGAGVLAHSVARRISGPIRDLTAATQRIARGDLQARVRTRSRDELRGLEEAFNQMATDLDRQRRELERSNRLAAWAEMARQVAHEVKNPLTPIQLSAEHLRRVFHDRTVDFERTLETCTETILKQVRTLRGIVTEFSSFARPPGAQIETQDLGALVGDLAKPYQNALQSGVHMTVDASESAPVRGDRRLLERALLNLIENAVQAVSEKGEIRIEVRVGGQRVQVTIEDSGPGIAPEALDHVFEPFFSTKTGGSGLGLALVKKIAEDHGGGVSIESSAGRGTRAVLWLPSLPPGAASTGPESSGEA